MSVGKRVKAIAVYIGSDTTWPPAPKVVIPGVSSPAVPSGSISGAGTTISATIDATNMDNIPVEVAWTGSLVGTFSIQGSVSGKNWKDLGLSITGPNNANGNILLDLNQLSFSFVRLVYTNASGTGTMTMFAAGKAL